MYGKIQMYMYVCVYIYIYIYIYICYPETQNSAVNPLVGSRGKAQETPKPENS